MTRHARALAVHPQPRGRGGRVAGIVSLAGFIPYIRAIWLGRTRPSLSTWVIWTFVSFMLYASYRASGAEATLWARLSYVVGPAVIVLLALRTGTREWGRIDLACLAASACAGIAWVLSGSPALTLALNIAVDCIGAVPTILKTCRDGESEDGTAWGLFLVGASCNLAAAERWDAATLAYPLYLFLIAAIMCNADRALGMAAAAPGE